MKLRRLEVRDYRVLKNLRIGFSPPRDSIETNTGTTAHDGYAIDFLVGVNGTGKSTVLRAIWQVFQYLEKKGVGQAPFGFLVEYELEGVGSIVVTNWDQETDELLPDLSTFLNGQKISLESRFLPHLIVAYTSGNEEDWQMSPIGQDEAASNLQEARSASPTELALRELPGKPVLAEYRGEAGESEIFLFVRDSHLPLITLCGLLADIAETETTPNRRLSEVVDAINIRRLCGFSLKFRMHRDVTTPQDREVFRRLARLATRTLQLGSDYLVVVDLSGREYSVARRIIDEFSGGLQLFKELSRLATTVQGEEPTLRDVNVFLERQPAAQSPLHLLSWLSDGERSFLGRMCLFALLDKRSTLILLDEPEVHFNDYWKREIVRMLDRALVDRQSHVLLTSHSSITVSDVRSEDVMVLLREGSNTTHSHRPQMRTFAADPSDILVHVFGAPNAAGAYSVNRIQEVLSRLEPSLERQQSSMGELEALLREVGPGYWSYRIRREIANLQMTNSNATS